MDAVVELWSQATAMYIANGGSSINKYVEASHIMSITPPEPLILPSNMNMTNQTDTERLFFQRQAMETDLIC